MLDYSSIIKKFRMDLFSRKNYMREIIHRITPSEIRYGVLMLSITDGVRKFFQSFENPVTINIHGITLSRTVGTQKIWMGYGIMAKFKPHQRVKISLNDNIICIEPLTEVNV